MERNLLFISITLFFFLLFNQVSAQTDQTVNSGDNTTAANFPGAGCVYNWVNSNPSIGLAASGTGDIASFKAMNNSNLPVTSTITATSAETGFAYIPNKAKDNLSVIDLASNTVTTVINVGHGPTCVAVSPDGSRIYVANSQDNIVSVINAATNSVISSINIVNNPIYLAVSPDGNRLYVVSQQNGTLLNSAINVINTSTNSIVSNIPVATFPTAIVVSPDNKWLYLVNSSAPFSVGYVSIINTITYAVTAKIPVGLEPIYIAINPNGNYLYVTNFFVGTVSVINIASNTVIATIQVGLNPYCLTVSPDGSRVYVSNYFSKTVSVISTQTNTVITTIQINDSPYGISISADGSRVYVIGATSSVVDVINTIDNTIVATIPEGFVFQSSGNFVSSGVGCSSLPIKFNITVNPAPPPTITISPATGNISACVGTTSASPNIQQFTISGNSLTGNITATAPEGFQVSLSAGNGFANSVTIGQAAGSVSNTIIYVRAAASTAPGNISGNVVLSAPGATNQNVAVTGTINPLPTVDPVSDQTVTNGSATTAINFTGTGNAAYNWTNDAPGIGLPVSGIGEIASFTAINKGTIPVVATITATPVPAEGYAYISNYNSSSVSVISTATFKVVTTIPVGDDPLGVSASPDGSKVYVANADGAISVISTATNTVINTILNNKINYCVAVSPDGKWLYDTDGISGDVLKINTTTNQQVSSISLTGAYLPLGVTLSPAGDRIYVANEGSNNISIVNSLSNAIIATINTGQRPEGIAVSPDNKYLYVVNENSSNVSVISTNSNSVIATIPVNEQPLGICISPDGSRVYVTIAGNNTVGVISTATNSIIATINVGLLPWGISISPDGRILYVVNNLSGSVSIINTTTNEVISTAYVGTYPRSPGNFVTQATGCPGVPIKFTITVNPSPPAITITGTPSSLTTVYGTPSASASFMVSGVNLPTGILVTPPPGFEVSMDNMNFSSTVTVGTAGNTAAVPVYIRLAAITAAGTYSGNAVLSSGSVTPVNVAAPNSIVTPAPLTITANNAGKFSGTTLISTTGSIYFTTAGLQNGDQIGTVDITYGNGAAIDAQPGTYTGSVMISGATGGTFNPANYTITYVPGDITVYPEVVTGITTTGTLTALTTTYGTPSVSVSFTVSGTNLTGDILITPPPGFEVSTDNTSFSSTVTIAAVNTNIPTLIYIRIAATTKPGSYSGNLTITSTGVTAAILVVPAGTVTPAPLMVTADDKTRTYGTPNPVLTVTYSGFVNNEGAAQLTYQPLITTTAIITSPDGNYPITASGAIGADYTITYAPGVLTITAPVQAIIIPNTFTPNGDGINDSWNLKYIDYYPNCTVNIFNRYGEKVYSSVGYPVPWDGRYKGAVLPTGVYYYIINQNNGNGLLSGNVTIIR